MALTVRDQGRITGPSAGPSLGDAAENMAVSHLPVWHLPVCGLLLARLDLEAPVVLTLPDGTVVSSASELRKCPPLAVTQHDLGGPGPNNWETGTRAWRAMILGHTHVTQLLKLRPLFQW